MLVEASFRSVAEAVEAGKGEIGEGMRLCWGESLLDHLQQRDSVVEQRKGYQVICDHATSLCIHELRRGKQKMSTKERKAREWHYSITSASVAFARVSHGAPHLCLEYVEKHTSALNSWSACFVQRLAHQDGCGW